MSSSVLRLTVSLNRSALRVSWAIISRRCAAQGDGGDHGDAEGGDEPDRDDDLQPDARVHRSASTCPEMGSAKIGR